MATSSRRGAARWQVDLLREGFAPLFLLAPQVQLAQRLDGGGASNRALARRALPAAAACPPLADRTGDPAARPP